MELEGIKKIISFGPDELSYYELARNAFSKIEDEKYLSVVEADVFLYWYENGGYDGYGIAVWRRDGKWRYDWLGHCSCNGPLDNVRTADNATFDIEEIIKIIENDYAYRNYEKLLNHIKRYYV